MEMTQEWIDSFHRKTMNFIGGFEIFNDFEGKERYIEIETGNTFLLEEMDWFDDWNWIHVILDKIAKIYYEEEPDNYSVYNLPIFAPKEGVIQAIDQFLTWYYNENK
jgi:hypothetical protein